MKKLPSILLLFNLLAVSLIFFSSVTTTPDKMTVAYSFPQQVSTYRKATSDQTIEAEQNNNEIFEESSNEQQPETNSTVSFPLELNMASQEELMLIPKVGEVTSSRIIQYREHLGGYSDLSQLKEIKGIGEATFKEITAYLYIEE